MEQEQAEETFLGIFLLYVEEGVYSAKTIINAVAYPFLLPRFTKAAVQVRAVARKISGEFSEGVKVRHPIVMIPFITHDRRSLTGHPSCRYMDGWTQWRWCVSSIPSWPLGQSYFLWGPCRMKPGNDSFSNIHSLSWGWLCLSWWIFIHSFWWFGFQSITSCCWGWSSQAYADWGMGGSAWLGLPLTTCNPFAHHSPTQMTPSLSLSFSLWPSISGTPSPRPTSSSFPSEITTPCSPSSSSVKWNELSPCRASCSYQTPLKLRWDAENRNADLAPLSLSFGIDRVSPCIVRTFWFHAKQKQTILKEMTALCAKCRLGFEVSCHDICFHSPILCRNCFSHLLSIAHRHQSSEEWAAQFQSVELLSSQQRSSHFGSHTIPSLYIFVSN